MGLLPFILNRLAASCALRSGGEGSGEKSIFFRWVQGEEESLIQPFKRKRQKIPKTLCLTSPSNSATILAKQKFHRMDSARTCWSRGTIGSAAQLILLACLLCIQPYSASAVLPSKLGDLDGDGEITVLDLVMLIDHINGAASLPPQLRGYAEFGW